jgi:hypothetical protein
MVSHDLLAVGAAADLGRVNEVNKAAKRQRALPEEAIETEYHC